MSYSHVIAWVDHTQAHIIHFNPEAAESEIIKTHSTHPHLHNKSGAQGSGHAPENSHYFDAIATAVNDAQEILIVGPGLEKLSLVKHLIKHHHDVAEKIISVETIDHPSDGQLLNYARKYFLKADQLL